ncbi:hypothetical protein LWI28_011238 [Acer negundo]|uniref:peptidyl-tRNA hydrolase n=1 Tax=Acer negundo TaxID=4023 RepID=A0AAD5JI15_ACENE|nr:hypothetical protein LWI28_007901 [Acer negundo]KAI9191636.1 hypothetical protein LWI28_011238 [Acer negundo]
MASILSPTRRFTAALTHYYLTPTPPPSIGAGTTSCSISFAPRVLSSRRRPRSISMSSDSSSAAVAAAAAADPTTNTVSSQNDNEDVLVQYVVLRRDLIDTWPLGSVVTQGCHASVSAIWSHKDDPHTSQYCSPQNIDSMHKVTLEVKGETQIVNLSEKLTAGGIDHKLWIEQPENFPTCLATKPYPKSTVSLFFKRLKLCK